MASGYPPPLRSCLEILQKLPGIGPKSAQRILFHLLDRGSEATRELARALDTLASSISLCPACRVYKSSDEPCGFCEDPAREGRHLCVVETASDVFLIEATGEFRGQYHVLHGLLSPLKGIRPEQLGLDALEKRVEGGGVEEVILATPPTAEGEATASYLAALLGGKVGSVTRIAYGLPVGADFQYVDPQTLSRALSGRKVFS